MKDASYTIHTEDTSACTQIHTYIQYKSSTSLYTQQLHLKGDIIQSITVKEVKASETVVECRDLFKVVWMVSDKTYMYTSAPAVIQVCTTLIVCSTC